MMHVQDPYLDDGMRGWIYKMAVQNYGRIANYELDDLVQEGYECFLKCKRRYVGKRGLRKRDGTLCRYLPPDYPDRDARRHFHSLVQTAFNNRLSTLALKQPKGWELAISTIANPEGTVEQAWEKLMPSDEEQSSVTVLLKSAPSEIKQLFQLLVADAVEGYNRYGKGRRGHRETNNQYFCRMLGLPENRNIVEEVNRHFLG